MIWTNDHTGTGVGTLLIFMTAVVCCCIGVAAQTNEVTGENDRTQQFRCESEGIYPDPNNCLVFYRCVDLGGLNNALQNEYSLFKFECAPDTVFNAETSACEATADASGAECTNKNSTAPKTTPNRNGKSAGYLPPVSSQSGSPSATQHPAEQIGSPVEVNNSLDPIALTTVRSGTAWSESDACRSDGFFSIPGNCTFFYRCVGNGDAGFVKHDFFCADGTIWDPNGNICNYPEAVQRTDCEISGDVRSAFLENPHPENGNAYPEGGAEEAEPASCTSEGFHPVEGDCTKFSRCVNIGEGKLIKYNFDCAEGTVWDQQLSTCNYPNAIDQSGCRRSNETALPRNDTLSGVQTSTPPSTVSVQDRCTAEGFFPSSGDCNKFYRCVRTAYDTYIMYNFNCGPGTVWDPVNNVCNYPEAVPGCGLGGIVPSNLTSGSTEQRSRPTSVTSVQDAVTVAPLTDCSNISTILSTAVLSSANRTTTDITVQTTTRIAPVINATSVAQTERTSPLTVSPTTVSEPVNATSRTEDSSDVCKERITRIQCDAEGYYPHPDDIRKFYRCVNSDENKNGSFSVFYFDCPAGTIFDSTTNICNHGSSVYTQPKYCNDTASTSTPLSPPSTTDSFRLTTDKSTVTADLIDISGRAFNPADATTAASTKITALPARPVTDGGTVSTVEQRTGGTEAVTKTTTQFSSSADSSTTGITTERRPSTTVELSPNYTVTTSSTVTLTTSPTQMITDAVIADNTTATDEPVTKTTQFFGSTANSTETSESLPTTTENQSSSSTLSIVPSTQTTVTDNATATESDITEETVTRSTRLPSTSDQPTNSTTTTVESHSTVEPSTMTAIPLTTPVAETSTSQISTQPAMTLSTSRTTVVSEQSTQPTDESTLNYSPLSQSTEQTTLISSTENPSTVLPTTMTGEERSSTSSNSSATVSSPTDQTVLPSTTLTVTQSTLTSPTSENQTISSPTLTTITTTASPKNSNSSTVSSRIYQDNSTPDEFSLVCPTALRRHPNYCNLLYQCTVSPTFEIKVVTLSCINGTVYDQRKSQCLPRDESEQCDGTIAEVKPPSASAIGMPLSPIPLKPKAKICPTVGSHPYPGNCKLFYKCKQVNGGPVEGHIYQCPNNYNYWNVSKRCEKSFKVPCNSADGDETKLTSSLAPNETQDIGTRR